MSASAPGSAGTGLPRRRLLLIAAAVFGLTFVANIPAALLYALFAPKDSTVAVHGLRGPWTEGALSGVSKGGRLVAQDLQWSLRPLQLLLGRIGAQLQGGGQIATLDGGVAVGLGGTRLTDFRFAGGIKNLAAAGGYAFVPVEGRVGGELARLVLKNGKLDYAEGRLELKNLAWTLARDPLLLGDFTAEITTAPEAVTAVITSPSGPLEASGSARLAPDQSYELDLLLKPRPGSSEMLLNYVKTLGAPDAQGNYRLRQRGKLS